jgi:hypothetical protein
MSKIELKEIKLDSGEKFEYFCTDKKLSKRQINKLKDEWKKLNIGLQYKPIKPEGIIERLKKWKVVK